MAESVKPRGNQLCSGTFGKLWIDGSLAYEAVSYTHLTLPTKA